MVVKITYRIDSYKGQQLGFHLFVAFRSYNGWYLKFLRSLNANRTTLADRVIHAIKILRHSGITGSVLMELCYIEDQPSWIYYYKYCVILAWSRNLIFPGKCSCSNEKNLYFCLSYSLLKSFDASKQKQLENDRNLSNLGPVKTSSSGRFVSVKPSKPASGNRVRSSSAASEDGTTRYVEVCRARVKQVNTDCWINSWGCYNLVLFPSDDYGFGLWTHFACFTVRLLILM